MSKSLNELLADAREVVKNRPPLAETLEGNSAVWRKQLAAHPPTTQDEREHYRAKAEEFRRLARAQLENGAQAAQLVQVLITRLGELSRAEEAAVLRDQIAAVLRIEAQTASAVASVLEVAILIDELT